MSGSAAGRRRPIEADTVLHTYTIFTRPADLPDAPFVVREFLVRAGHVEPGALLGVGESLQEARALVPAGAVLRMSPARTDHPSVVEIWL